MARKNMLLAVSVGIGLTAASVTLAHAAETDLPSERTPAAAQTPAGTADPVTRSARIQKQLKMALGAEFGGAWVTDGSQVVVATTDAASAAAIKAAGAQPKVVKYSERTLMNVLAGLNRHARSASESVTAWYVDTDSNTVVVRGSSTAAVKRFVKVSGVNTDAVSVVRSKAAPRPLHDIIGGERYWTTKYGCSVAFSVQGGFVSAGHCGKKGETTKGDNQVEQGTFGGSSFPGDDYAWIDTNSQWTPTPKVTTWKGGYETVRGATAAPVGTDVCRSGATTNTQLWCGKIKELNATVNYPDIGAVTGLIRTDICADPGDSGGAMFTKTGGQAQGMTSGGSGSCKDGQDGSEETFFQPVTEVLEILAKEGRGLITADGGRSGRAACDNYRTRQSGSLTRDADDSHAVTTTATGAFTACLDGPAGIDFDLYLQKLNGGTWQTVAQSAGPTSEESITYTGSPGAYRYRVHAYSGSGTYTLGFNRP